ncbi:MAG: alternate F1F0 ATPase, F1 subunit alpha [Alphaproteobacteria bacterium]|nr:alternate F1F0 ATPase, F1 subunit alpha [Alphaproteobacteria bacterium]
MLREAVSEAFGVYNKVLADNVTEIRSVEIGIVETVSGGTALVRGLEGAKLDELIIFPDGLLGMATTLEEDYVGVILLGDQAKLKAGDEVKRSGRVVDVPVGEALLGRVVDAVGRPLDNKGNINATEKRQIEREAYPIMDRKSVSVPLQTGVKAIDALVPIGRGQRELVLGDRQTGKTAICIDSIINQKDSGVISIYCAIGQRASAVAKVIADLEKYGVLDKSIVVVGAAEDSPGLQFMAPYAATAIGEYLMEQGKDVLIIYDDLTRQARAYRQMSLLLRRPPGREAYPGDIFYIHSRLLERSTRLKPEHGGGSITALPIIETQAQNISAYIPTNVISITDGQIYLSPTLFQKGMMPAIDAGKSVSRVGGNAQVPAYRAVAGDLRLSFAQYEELETFARFGTQLDEETTKAITRGRRVREVLKQNAYEPLPVEEQIAVLLACTNGIFDPIELDEVAKAEIIVREAMKVTLADKSKKVLDGEKLSDEDIEHMLEIFAKALQDSGMYKKDDE